MAYVASLYFRRSLAPILCALFALIGSSTPAQPSATWFRLGGDNQNSNVGAGSGCTATPLWFTDDWANGSAAGPEAEVVQGPEGNVYGCIWPGGEEGSNILYALSGSTGQVLWSLPSQDCLSVPAVGADGTVYVAELTTEGIFSADANLYALDPATGAVKWTYDVGTSGTASTPVIDKNGTIYTFSVDEPNTYTVEAINGAAGTLVWSNTFNRTLADSSGYDFSCSMALSPDDTQLYFGPGGLYALNTTDGSLTWYWQNIDQTGGGGLDVPPIVGPDGTVYGLNNQILVAWNGQTGDLKWIGPDGCDTIPSLSPDGKTLYTSMDLSESPCQLAGVDTSTGNVILRMNFCGGQLASQPSGYMSRVAVGSDGTLYAADLEYTFTYNTGEYINLYAIDPTEGAILWSTPTTPGGVYGQGPYEFIAGTEMRWQGPSISPNGTIYTPAREEVTGGNQYDGIAAFGSNSLANFYTASSRVAGGSSTKGVAQVSQAAGPLGATVVITSNSSNVAVSNVTLAAGSKGKSFQIIAQPVSQTQTATLTAKYGTSSKTTTLTITPAALATVTASPATINAGSATALTVGLGGKAGPGGVAVSLSSSSSNLPVPASAMIASGSGGTSLTLNSLNGATRQTVTVTATEGSITRQTTVTLMPNKLESFYVSPTAVIAGVRTRGVAQIQFKAGAGGNTISLKSGTAAVQVPSTVVIPAGTTGVSFPITTSQVSSTLGVGLIATFGPFTLHTSLTVYPGLARIYASPASVKGGTMTHGVVQLGGSSAVSQTISLSSSSILVSLPASVTIPANSGGVSFVISTKTVASATNVVITAREGAASKMFTITITS